MLGGIPANADDEITAGTVLTNMEPGHFTAYLAGVVEGFAYARYQQDGGATDGMRCIYDWFYKGEDTQLRVMSAFAEYPDYTPGAVVLGLIQKECAR